tara:strand:+ start:207 stop:371 length:165 start_codon:yes stop_codon:yes gene_type:complete
MARQPAKEAMSNLRQTSGFLQCQRGGYEWMSEKFGVVHPFGIPILKPIKLENHE